MMGCFPHERRRDLFVWQRVTTFWLCAPLRRESLFRRFASPRRISNHEVDVVRVRQAFVEEIAVPDVALDIPIVVSFAHEPWQLVPFLLELLNVSGVQLIKIGEVQTERGDPAGW